MQAVVTDNMTCTSSRRDAFTLIEVLIVITIIAVLLTLSVGAVTRYTSSQYQANTVNLLRTLDGALKRQWSKTVDQARKANVPSSLVTAAGGNPDRARVMLIKMYLKQAFPVTFDEARSDVSYGGHALRPSGAFTSVPPSSAATQPYESSILLLLALQRNEALSADNLGGAAVTSCPAAPNFQYLRDGWGTPLVFSRWPMDSYLATTGVTGYSDTDDPTGLLSDTTWANQGAFFSTIIGHGFVTPIRLAPQIVSAGADKNTGLSSFPTLAGDSSAAAQDNISSVTLPGN